MNSTLMAGQQFPKEIEQAIALHRQGQFSTAIGIYDRFLQGSQDASLWHLRGLAEHQQGHPARALPCLLRAVELEPRNARILASLGAVYWALDRIGEAGRAWCRAIELHPELTAAWRGWGDCLLKEKRFAEATDCLQQVKLLAPDDTENLRKLAGALANSNQPTLAEAAYEDALKADKCDATLLNEYATWLRQAGKLPRAVQLYEQATRLDVRRPGVWCNYGATLHELKRHRQAEDALKQALRLQPHFAGAHFNLANLYRDQNRYGEACEHYEQAISLDSDFLDFRINYISLLNCLGKFDESAAQCRDVIQRHPDYAPAYYNLFTFNADQVTEEEVSRLKELLETSTMDQVAQSNAWFSLAKRSDRLGDYDEAFACFQRANYLSPRRTQFNHERLQQLIDRMQAVFCRDSPLFSRIQGSESEQPIFILGMPRSGSTLIDQILTSHSQVRGAGEFDGIRHLITNFLDRPFRIESQKESAYPQSLRDVTSAYVDEMASVYLERLQRTTGDAVRITDKMPNNAFQLGLISLLFPKATVIYTKRDPRDICLSCYFQNFTAFHEFSFDLRNVARFYREHVRLMNHWKAVLPIQIHDVSYEALISDQETETHRLIEEICGLPWEDACLRFHENKRAVHTASLWQVRQPIYQQSNQKWKHYEKQIGPLLDELSELIEQPASENQNMIC